MTIKITSISLTSGEIILGIAFDNPSGSGKMQSFNLRKQDLVDRLVQVRQLLGRPLTLTDARQSVVAVVNEVRSGRQGVPEDFDFKPYIGVELET
jgi:hypothetical protein